MIERANLYTVYDTLAEKYGPIFEAVNNAVALRQFINLKNGLPEVSRRDYQLMLVGFIERDKECVITPHVTMEIIEEDDEIRRIR